MDKSIINKFYFDQDTNLPNLNNYGKYRLGLTKEEIIDYLKVRAWQLNKKFTKETKNKFDKIAGCNTCAVVDGIVLMYRHDVERFAEVLFNNKTTYWD